MGYTPHVVVVGGGAVGTAIARDLALRGLEVTLLEAERLAAGRTGGASGVLHSGARFVESDSSIARRCRDENRTLFETARHCIEDTGGLLLAEDGESLADRQAACEEAGIATTLLSGDALADREESLPADLAGALRVPAAVIDPFRLTVDTARNAAEYGATIRTHARVSDVIVEDGTLAALEVTESPIPPVRPAESSPAETDEANGTADDGDGDAEDDAESGEEDAEADDGTSDGEGDDGEDEESDGGDIADDRDGDEDSDDGEAADGDGEGEDAEGEAADRDSKDERNGENEGSDDGKAGDEEDDGGRSGPHYHKQEITPVTSPRRDNPVTEKLERPDEPVTSGQVPGMTDADDERPEPAVETIDADYVVNAAGVDADRIVSLAGGSLSLSVRESRSVVTDGRSVDSVICRLDAEGPFSGLVPHGQRTLLAGGDRGGSDAGVADAVDETVADVGAILPATADPQALRSFARAHYQVAGRDRPAAHGHSFITIDHAKQDCWGMTTVLGGSLTTHRYVAETVADTVCSKFGISRECQTAELPLADSATDRLPGETEDSVDPVAKFGLSQAIYERIYARLGSQTNAVLSSDTTNPVLCECESVTRAEVHHALADETAAENDLDAVRIRTKATMGTCQGGQCAHRLATVLHPNEDPEVVEDALSTLLAGRWRGQRSATWGEQLRSVARTYRLHAATLDRKFRTSGQVHGDVYDPGRIDAHDLTGHTDRKPVDGDGMGLGPSVTLPGDASHRRNTSQRLAGGDTGDEGPESRAVDWCRLPCEGVHVRDSLTVGGRSRPEPATTAGGDVDG